MKSLLMSTLLTLGLATSVVAQDLAVGSYRRTVINEITPFDLVSNTYQGYLEDQGIPSASSFVHAVRTNKVEAEDLVRAAIAKGRLSEDTINDEAYISYVDLLMDNLDKN